MIRWSTLIADEQGVIDYQRVRSLASVFLALVGGVCAVWVIFIVRELKHELVYAMIGALVLPLTGGKISDALQAVASKRASAAVVAGAAPGRRSSDAAPAPDA